MRQMGRRYARLGAVLASLVLLGSIGAASVLALSQVWVGTNLLSPAADGTFLVVNSGSGFALDDGFCTLPEAIDSANTNIASGASAGECAAGSSTGTDSITFDVSGTIALNADLPEISSDLNIDGENTITVDGGDVHGLFTINAGIVRLERIEIRNGLNTAGGSGISNAGTLTVDNTIIESNLSPDSGGGIANTGILTIQNSTLGGNSSGVGDGGQGGAIFNNGGSLIVTNSSILGNVADAGAGIANINGGIITITNSSFGSNAAGVVGGGLSNTTGTITVIGSSFGSNSAGTSGGGIYNSGIITTTSSTFGSNAAGTSGGGIYNSGTITISNSALGSNAAGTTGGAINVNGSGILISNNISIIGNSAVTSGGGLNALGTENVSNSLIIGNNSQAGIDVSGNIEISNTNLIGIPLGNSLGGIVIVNGGGNPVIADNGGPTNTIALALVDGNPAIDTGDSATCAAAPVSGLDQRALPRPSACDIGSYEAQPPTVAPHGDVTEPSTSADGAVVSYSAPTASDEQGQTLAALCDPPSGSLFPVGSTTITCTATDAVGHTATGTFQVIVEPFVTPVPPITPPPVTPAPPVTPGPSITLAPSIVPTQCPCDIAPAAEPRPEALGWMAVVAILVFGVGLWLATGLGWLPAGPRRRQ
jgi:hypothetical protein